MDFNTDEDCADRFRTGNRFVVYHEPPPPTPAPGEVGTELQQLNAAFMSIDLAEAAGTTTVVEWANAYRIVMQREWIGRDVASDDWQAINAASLRRLQKSIARLQAVELSNG